jgi:hypothetical protein
MSRQPTRQSERIRDPPYQRRTTWRLPEIASVCSYSLLLKSDNNFLFPFVFGRLSLLHPMPFLRLFRALHRLLRKKQPLKLFLTNLMIFSWKIVASTGENALLVCAPYEGLPFVVIERFC